MNTSRRRRRRTRRPSGKRLRSKRRSSSSRMNLMKRSGDRKRRSDSSSKSVMLPSPRMMSRRRSLGSSFALSFLQRGLARRQCTLREQVWLPGACVGFWLFRAALFARVCASLRHSSEDRRRKPRAARGRSRPRYSWRQRTVPCWLVGHDHLRQGEGQVAQPGQGNSSLNLRVLRVHSLFIAALVRESSWLWSRGTGFELKHVPGSWLSGQARACFCG